jgi:hypothetical protein
MNHLKRRPLPSRRAFIGRLVRSAALGVGMIGFSLGVGILGYRFLVGLPWIDALLNASMILTGMGPVSRVETVAGKLFASGYALFSGVVFLVAAGVIFTPVVHRFLHRFHLETEATTDGPNPRGASGSS